MELFEEIRRGHAAGETILGLAKKHGVHRRVVRQAIASAIPPEKRKSVRDAPKLGPVKEHIDRMLEADRQAPRKQRHTAHRIWTRLREEHSLYPIGEPTVRRYVRFRKRELGLSGREVFVPQSYDWGQEGQVDWFEARARLGDNFVDSSIQRWNDGPYGAISLMELLDISNHQMTLSEVMIFRSGLSSLADSTILSQKVREDGEKYLCRFQEECNSLSIDAAADLLAFIREFVLKNDGMTVGELRHRLNDVSYIFQTQGAKQVFFRLNREDSGMFQSTEPFGAEVAKAFSSPESTYESSEAVKCYGLGRYTASVFHLMRVLEKGLKALADNLAVPFSIPFEYLNWQNIIEPIEAEIRKLEKQSPSAQKTETLKAYAEIAKQFRYFKDAWRNHVAHSRETYDREQALSILRHTGEFMRDLVKLGVRNIGATLCAIIKAVKYDPTEYDKFTSLVDRVLAVPHSVIKQRVEEERKRAAQNPNRPGPKPKRKVTRPSA